jgi:predicted membrane protein
MDASLFQAAPYTGYVFPNETDIPWSLMIVIYPYITGLVAGSFTVATFYHVFGVSRFKPLARFALLTSLSFMVFVPVPLLMHLGHPERALNVLLTPHLTSAFAAFGFFAAFYVILVSLEIWFSYREDIVRWAQEGSGMLGRFYRVLTLGSYEISATTRAYDAKWIKALAIVGIVGAHGLHGYVGFVFGSLKSREWWGSDLMPAIFLVSAIVSGISILIVLYVLTSRLRRTAVDKACLKGLAYMLWGFLIFAMVLEFLEFANIVYKALVVWHLGTPGGRIRGVVLHPDVRHLARHSGQATDRRSNRFGATDDGCRAGHALERGDRRTGTFKDHARPVVLLPDLPRSRGHPGLHCHFRAPVLFALGADAPVAAVGAQ